MNTRLETHIGVYGELDMKKLQLRKVGVENPKRGYTFCKHCKKAMFWQHCPTGGWWIHFKHPLDGHDAEPKHGVNWDE
jgi:Fe-S-cluster-containing dehydrogenase component